MHLFTPRLILRPIEQTDWTALRDIWRDFSASEYAPYDMPHETEDEAVRRRIARWVQHAGREHMFFAVCLDARVIGYVAFNIREGGYETGYCFHSAYHGQGYAREALAALLEHLHVQGVTAFFAGTALSNLPSVRLLQSLGFALAGTEPVSFYADETGRPIVFEGGLFEKRLPPVG